jgi:hypothetical protein
MWYVENGHRMKKLWPSEVWTNLYKYWVFFRNFIFGPEHSGNYRNSPKLPELRPARGGASGHVRSRGRRRWLRLLLLFLPPVVPSLDSHRRTSDRSRQFRVKLASLPATFPATSGGETTWVLFHFSPATHLWWWFTAARPIATGSTI